ncbi:MAG: hypothetical protein U0V18_14005 [Anaerolineales bacterium]
MTGKAKKVPITIIAALVTVVGTIMAALISISPDVFGGSNKVNPTPTLITLKRYDDVLKIFSIDYPPSLYIVERAVEGTCFDVVFSGTTDVSGREILTIAAYKADEDRAFERINEIINQNIGNSPQSLLVSSKDMNNGYYVHYINTKTDNVLRNYYFYYEQKDNTVIYTYYFREGSPLYEESVIESVFSSFTWSPDKVSELCK